MTQSPFRIARITCTAYRFTNEVPVETSFGTMRDRPAVFVRVEDEHGTFGLGEIFANWPAAGAEHRVNLLEWDIAPALLGRTVTSPDTFFTEMSRLLNIRAIQCGEQGPFNQVLAGIDIALWDLQARRAGVPLRRLLAPDAPDQVPAYSSGIHIRAAEREIGRARRAGHRHFKVKVGFDNTRDALDVLDLLGDLGPGETLAADANQGWGLASAASFLDQMGAAALDWIEEPLAADAPLSHWNRLHQLAEIPIAAGENIFGYRSFVDAISSGVFDVIQPDVAKWGGVSGCLRVARAALSAGLRYCPHFLGGGIGLVASGEVLAAVGGDGRLEVDANENPLRDLLTADSHGISDGSWTCSSQPGLGIGPLPVELEAYRTGQADLTASQFVRDLKL